MTIKAQKQYGLNKEPVTKKKIFPPNSASWKTCYFQVTGLKAVDSSLSESNSCHLFYSLLGVKKKEADRGRDG